MGCFDSVIAVCPECGANVEFQSKAGECDLRTYKVTSVPVVIAIDLDGTSRRCTCGEFVTIGYHDKPIRVAMHVDYEGSVND